MDRRHEGAVLSVLAYDENKGNVSGRVAILIENQETECWGVDAFQPFNFRFPEQGRVEEERCGSAEQRGERQ